MSFCDNCSRHLLFSLLISFFAFAFAIATALRAQGRTMLHSNLYSISTPALAICSNELVGCLEDLREKREDLHRSLLRDEEEKVCHFM